MAIIILESFAGVETADQLVGKWTTVNASARIIDAGPCRALANDQDVTSLRPVTYDFAASEVDNFVAGGFRAFIPSLAFGNPRFVVLSENTEPVEEEDCWVSVLTSGAVVIQRDDSTGAVTVASTPVGAVVEGQPFTVGFEILKSNTAGVARIWVDGVLLATASSIDTWGNATPTGTFSRVRVGGGLNPSSVGQDPATDSDWITSFFLFNSLGTDDRSYPGSRDVGVSFLTGDGPLEEMDPGAGAGGNWTFLDERDVTDGTDVVSADTAGLEDSYAHRAAEGTGALGPVQVTARVRKTLASDVQLSLRARLGASTSSSPALLPPGSGWGNVRYGFSRAPNGGTWDIGDFDATFVGARSLVVASGQLEIEQMYVEYLVETYDPVDCGAAATSEAISEFSDSDINLLSDIGPPNVPEHLVSDTWDVSWVEEDPGGFMEGRISFPLPIDDVSPINYYDDIYYDFLGLERYRGRAEKIDRRSDAGGMWLDGTLAGWIQNAQADRKYWGKLQQLAFDGVEAQGVSVSNYMQQITHEVGHGSDMLPLLRVTAPAGTGLGVPSGVYQFLIQTDPYSPNPGIQRLRFRWRASQLIPGARFQIIAYSPVGSLGTPTVIYNELHSTTDQIVSLYQVGTTSFDTGEGEPGDAVIPVGTWRILVRPIAFTLAVSTIPEPGLVIGIASPANESVWCYGQMPTISPLRASAVVERILEDSCPALDTSEITQTDELVKGLVIESPTEQVAIIEDMLRYSPAGFTYWVREKLGNDLYRFFYGARSDVVWYEVEHVEIQGMGGEAGVVYNRATVSYEDYLGQRQTASKEQSVGILNDVSASIGTPFVREIYRDIGKLRGSTGQENKANAELICDALLAESAAPAEVGQFRVIGKQVYDLVAGAYVDFRTLIPGRLIRVKDTGTGDAAIWRIHRLEKTLGMGMECQVVVGRGTSNLDQLIARLQARDAG